METPPDVSTKVDVWQLTQEMRESWQSLSVGAVNTNVVRLRVMQDAIARWHYHQHSEEMFYVITGQLFIDLEARTEELGPGQMLVVPCRVKHRARAHDRTTVLVIDAINEDTHWVE